jgi:hypothetical protein
MGLDMYLTAERYFWFDEKKPVIDGHEIQSVRAEAIYWRKANQIHNWFVEQIQNGEDECQEHSVGREKLVELRSLCKEAISNPDKAQEILPNIAGFFFGATHYNEWYIRDLEHTIEGIDRILTDFPAEKWEFHYRSSW